MPATNDGAQTARDNEIRAIREAARGAREALQAQEKDLAGKARHLEMTQPGATAQIVALETAAQGCREAIGELGFSTLEAINASAEVQDLINKTKTVNAKVKAELEKVQQVVAVTETIKKVADAAVKIVGGLTKLVALV